MTVVEYADEFKVKVPPKRLFKALITDGHDNLPKIVPHIVKSTNVHEGEGGTTGCVRKLSFSEGAPLSHMKDKFEVVDTENLVVKIAVVEDAKLGEKCESIKCEKRFVDSGDGGCIVKWKTQQHQKPGRTHVSEEEIKSMHELMVSILIAAETYLVAHPEVSAY